METTTAAETAAEAQSMWRLVGAEYWLQSTPFNNTLIGLCLIMEQWLPTPCNNSVTTTEYSSTLTSPSNSIIVLVCMFFPMTLNDLMNNNVLTFPYQNCSQCSWSRVSRVSKSEEWIQLLGDQTQWVIDIPNHPYVHISDLSVKGTRYLACGLNLCQRCFKYRRCSFLQHNRHVTYLSSFRWSLTDWPFRNFLLKFIISKGTNDAELRWTELTLRRQTGVVSGTFEGWGQEDRQQQQCNIQLGWRGV